MTVEQIREFLSLSHAEQIKHVESLENRIAKLEKLRDTEYYIIEQRNARIAELEKENEALKQQ